MSMWRFVGLGSAGMSYCLAECFSESSDKGSLKVPKLLACCAEESSLNTSGPSSLAQNRT
jgi:hypothetical protein